MSGRLIVLLVAVCVCGTFAYGLTVLESGYQVDSFVTLDAPGMGNAKFLSFDDAGNLYVTYDGETNGGMVKVTPEKDMSVFVTGLGNLQGVQWGGGTTFGDNLYAANYTQSQISVVALDGQSQSLVTLPARPITLGLDRTGNYGGNLFVGTRYGPSIIEVSADGSYSTFVEFPGLGGDFSPFDIAIDPTGSYGGLMYVNMYAPGTDWRGVLTVDSEGNTEIFLSQGFGNRRLEFDTTDGELFGGGMLLGGGTDIMLIAPDGSSADFLVNSGMSIRDFVFGPDNAMYVLQNEVGSPATITRIALIPEPATLLLLGLGGLVLRRRR